MLRVPVQPRLLQWARDRASRDIADLTHAFPKLAEWESGVVLPTLKQLEKYAAATYTPIGFFFLPEPPVDRLPIPDFRTIGGRIVERPSPNLLDTIHACEQRQEWYREFARVNREEVRGFVGSAGLSSDTRVVAADLQRVLRYGVAARKVERSWSDALRLFIERAEAAGILVMCSGIVSNNTSRTLDPQEFRGFALSDPLAPLVFVNGADSRAAQMFTLAHEIAHLWLGASGVSDASAAAPTHATERWCNQVAAEFLLPMADFQRERRLGESVGDAKQRLAAAFKLSTLVVLRRMFDGGWLRRDEFEDEYEGELRFLVSKPKGAGGNFYLTQAARVSRRFASALIVDTLEGNTLERDAFRLLSISKAATFREFGSSLGIAVP